MLWVEWENGATGSVSFEFGLFKHVLYRKWEKRQQDLLHLSLELLKMCYGCNVKTELGFFKDVKWENGATGSVAFELGLFKHVLWVK